MLKRASLAVLLCTLPPGIRAEGPARKEIDAAVARGVAYLRAQERPGVAGELVALALLHGGVPPSDPAVLRLLTPLERDEPAPTYNTALAIMVLHRADAVRYQKRIAWKAALLVQNQCANGQWDYKLPENPPKEYPVAKEEALCRVYVDDPVKGSKLVLKSLPCIPIPPQSAKPRPRGCNSNAQYAILGLRAAAESGCRIPPETWQRTQAYLGKALRKGGLAYDAENGNPGSKVPTGTMTSAGVAMAAICDTYLKIPLQDDPALQEMVRWLDRTFQPDRSTWLMPKDPDAAHYYYLYGIERAAGFAERKTLHGSSWYEAGAAWLLKRQARDGSWHNSGKDGNFPPAVDTAFAILFLTRSTMPLGYEVGDGTPVPPQG